MSSMAETYILASRARSKLTREAGHADHDLRKLVHHANLLDNLMEKIQDHKHSILQQHSTKASIYDLGSDSDSDEDDEEEEEYEVEEYRAAQPVTILGADKLYPNDTHVSFSQEEPVNDTVADVMTSEQIYNSDENDSDYEDDGYEDEEEEDDDEEEDIVQNFTWSSQDSSNKRFRHMPTIDELTEKELDDLEVESDDDEVEEKEEEEEEEVDIVDLKRTPSLNYTSSTEDESEVSSSEDESDEEYNLGHLHKPHSHHTHHHHHHHHKQSQEQQHTNELLMERIHGSMPSIQQVLC